MGKNLVLDRLRRGIVALLVALVCFFGTGADEGLAQEAAPPAEPGVNVACLAQDAGMIAGMIPGVGSIAGVIGGIGAVVGAVTGEQCTPGEGITGLAGAASEAVKDKLYDSTIGKFIESLLIANGQVFKTIFTWWIAVPTVDMGGLGAEFGGMSEQQMLDLANLAGEEYSRQTGEENPVAGATENMEESELSKVGAGGNLGGLANPAAGDGSVDLLQKVNSYTGQLQVWLLMLGLILGFVRVAWAHHQAQGQEALAVAKGVTRAVTIAMGFSLFVMLATRFSDNLSVWWMNEMVQPDQLARFADRIMRLQDTTASAALVFIVALIVLITALIQVAIIIIRNALLVLVVAVMPLAAAASLTKLGNASVEKMMGWTVALILFKPVAALIYCIAIMMMADSDGPWEIITGMALMAMAVVALPALITMVAPATQAVGGGVSGMAVGGAMAGVAGAALGIGAMAATGGASAAVTGGMKGGAGIGALSKSGGGGALGSLGGFPASPGGASSPAGLGSGGPSGSGSGGGSMVGFGPSGAGGESVGTGETAGHGGSGAVGGVTGQKSDGQVAPVGAGSRSPGGQTPGGGSSRGAGGAASAPTGGGSGGAAPAAPAPAPSGGGGGATGSAPAAPAPAPSGGGGGGATGSAPAAPAPAPSGGGGGGATGSAPAPSGNNGGTARALATYSRVQSAGTAAQQAVRQVEQTVNSNIDGFDKPTGG